MTENKRFTVFQDSYDTIYIKDKDIYRGDGLRIGDEEYVKFENVLKVVDLLNDLNNENEHIKHLIKEAYQTERTDLGKSVLKQLLEVIQ